MKFFKAENYFDQRGVIMNASPMNPEIRNVMYITGREDAQRGNHVHKKDSHYCMVVYGNIRYEWQDVGSNVTQRIDMKPGDIVLSEPGEKHRFIFLDDAAFIAMATEPRTQELYESDTTRVNF